MTLFGFASDTVRTSFGLSALVSLRYTLMGSALLYLVPAFFYWRASRRIESELTRFEGRRWE